MRKLITTCAILSGLSGIGMADTWDGTLLDANCLQRHHHGRTCDAKPSSTAFVLESNGTRYRLDGDSNDNVRATMEARADKASNRYATKATPVHARLTGRVRSSGKIRANVVEIDQ